MPAKTEPAKPIEIVSVKRTRKSIKIAWTQGDSHFELDEHDNPLPTFTEALDALTPLVATILHLPREYADTGLRVVGFSIDTMGGAQTVSISARKDIDDAMKQFAFVTPARLLAHPAEEGKYTPPLVNADVEHVLEAIEQAKRYVKGERAQGVICFDDEEDDDDGEDSTDAPLPGLTVTEILKDEKEKRKRSKKEPTKKQPVEPNAA